MRNRIWYIAPLAAVALSLVACKTILCRAKDKAVDALTDKYAEVLECSGKPAIKEMFNSAADAVGVCKTGAPTGPIADALCKPVIDAVLKQLTGLIPEAHGCKATKVTADLSAKLVEKCESLKVDE